MRANIAMGALVLVSGIALAAPGFAQQDRNYPNGARAGSYGMDVAPGGGVYTRADAAAEPADRMSHPIPGERRAPSNVAQGSLAQVDAAENAETARLNEQQLNGQTAQLPSNQ
jgi:hypothetical protein